MLCSPFTSPRKLALLAVGIFVIALVVLQRSPYKDHLPNAQFPGFSPNNDVKSGLQEGEERPIGGSWRSAVGGGSRRPTQHNAPHVTELKEKSASSQTAFATVTPPSRHSPFPAMPSSANETSPTRTTVQHTFPTLPKTPYQTIQSNIQELLAHWTPPAVPMHWPPYEWYIGQDYDPNRWEGFDWDNDFYINNGINRLKKEKPAAATPVTYLPYPEYNSDEWRREWKGEYVPCEGARGKLLNESSEDWLKAYPAIPNGFPDVAVGNANAVGIDIDHCFDRYGRFSAYGYGQEEGYKILDWMHSSVKPDWEAVNWGQLQDQCLLANKERYNTFARRPSGGLPGKGFPVEGSPPQEQQQPESHAPRHHHRTAILIRAWEGYRYTENDIEAIRSLVTELSLLSGGEYQVFLFVNIKDPATDIYTNQHIYQDLLKQHVPRELRDMTILWNEQVFREWYPDIGDWQVYWHQFMPLQWFSKKYPEFEYVWNWETDARYTGNHYHFLEKVAEFARKQARKYLWEKNARFYFPSAHGTYQQWLDDTYATIQAAIENGTMQSVWGPQPYNTTAQHPIGPPPPHAEETDDFEWGVDEEADLITLQPIWDPVHTHWTFRDKIWNYIPGHRPHFTAEDPLDDTFTHPNFPHIPRRTYINTMSRFSRRQLHAMHSENVAGRTMQAEMWPASVALQHGLKAVYAPHPIWLDRHWPPWYLDAVFNAGGHSARWGQQADSVYNHDREHNFAGFSWYYNADFPRVLYRRWLGWSARTENALRGLGGPEYEDRGVVVEGTQAAPAGVRVGGEGRMCLPPMLLHPLKNVYEGAEREEEEEPGV